MRAGRGLWEPIGWVPHPGPGDREGFLEEVMTKLRLKMHRRLPMCPLHLEHCLIYVGCSIIICWMNEQMRKNVLDRRTA